MTDRLGTKNCLIMLGCMCWLACTGIRATTIPCKNEVGKSDTLNKVDDFNRKTGYWIEYLNSNMRPVQCKKAQYWQLAFYWHGERVLPMGPPKRPLSGVPSVSYTQTPLVITTESNPISILDGVVILKYCKSTIVRTYEAGMLTKETYSTISEDNVEIIDYSNHYKSYRYTCKIYSKINKMSRTEYYGVIDGQVRWVIAQ